MIIHALFDTELFHTVCTVGKDEGCIPNKLGDIEVVTVTNPDPRELYSVHRSCLILSLLQLLLLHHLKVRATKNISTC